MCVVSMVHDHYNEPFRKWLSDTPVIQPWIPVAEIEELRKLIREFREALTAAKRVDELTNQPDCVDPKKATLEERVAELERRLRVQGATGGPG